MKYNVTATLWTPPNEPKEVRWGTNLSPTAAMVSMAQLVQQAENNYVTSDSYAPMVTKIVVEVDISEVHG